MLYIAVWHNLKYVPFECLQYCENHEYEGVQQMVHHMSHFTKYRTKLNQIPEKVSFVFVCGLQIYEVYVVQCHGYVHGNSIINVAQTEIPLFK